MKLYTPDIVYIERSVRNSPLALSVREHVGCDRVELITSAKSLIEELTFSGRAGADAKRRLLLMQYKGNFLKPCPGTRGYVCCNYLILNFALNCPMGCSYCVLQGYFDNPLLIIHANVEEMFRELERTFHRRRRHPFRVGTGEFTDSLALDHLTGFTTRAVPFFAHQPNAFLELKTKTDNIGNLVGLPHGGRTIVAWSLNPDAVIAHEEHQTASLAERLRAAQACQDAGYLLAFHFDPIIQYNGWERDYESAIERLLSSIDATRIVWISLGCLRFPPRLKGIIEEKFPSSRLPCEEFIEGDDGKLRYFRPLRTQMYRHLVGHIHQRAPHVRVYLCMESRRVWEHVFGMHPRNDAHLNALLGRSCIERCKLTHGTDAGKPC